MAMGFRSSEAHFYNREDWDKVENDKVTGITVTLFTVKGELELAKKDATMLVAFDQPDKKTGRTYQFEAPLDACDLLDNGQVRVNLTQVRLTTEKIGTLMGRAMGEEFQNAFGPLMALLEAESK